MDRRGRLLAAVGFTRPPFKRNGIGARCGASECLHRVESIRGFRSVGTRPVRTCGFPACAPAWAPRTASRAVLCCCGNRGCAEIIVPMPFIVSVLCKMHRERRGPRLKFARCFKLCAPLVSTGGALFVLPTAVRRVRFGADRIRTLGLGCGEGCKCWLRPFRHWLPSARSVPDVGRISQRPLSGVTTNAAPSAWASIPATGLPLGSVGRTERASGSAPIHAESRS